MFVAPVRGKVERQQIGRLCSYNGQMGYLAGYTKCEHCNKRLKVLYPITEAKEFAIKFCYKEKIPLKVRLAGRLQKWINNVMMFEASWYEVGKVQEPTKTSTYRTSHNIHFTTLNTITWLT